MTPGSEWVESVVRGEMASGLVSRKQEKEGLKEEEEDYEKEEEEDKEY